MSDTDYPAWICDECARAAGGWMRDGHLSTYHTGTCGVCGERRTVTEPRDWHYPPLEGIQRARQAADSRRAGEAP